MPLVVRQVVLPPVDDSDRYTVEKFRKNGAEVFIGGTDPMKAESWIEAATTHELVYEDDRAQKYGKAAMQHKMPTRVVAETGPQNTSKRTTK